MKIADFDPEFVRVANLTSRAKGAVGSKALVPQFVEKIAGPKDSILDYGAGKHAAHTQYLRDKGYNVTAYDFGANIDPELHDPAALKKKYNIVFASNVLNVQSSRAMLAMTLDQIKSVLASGGQFIGNLPMSPRKATDIDSAYVQGELENRFSTVQRIGGTKQAPVFLAKNPK